MPGGNLTIQAGSPCKAPPPIFGLELRAPMGTYTGHYGTKNVINRLSRCP